LIRFKTEVEIPTLRDAWDNLKFFLKVDLMHMEATEEDIKHPGSASIGHSRHLFNDEQWVLSKFKCVSSRQYKLNNIITLFKGSSKGMSKQQLSHSLLVPFDSLHFSSLSLSLFTMLMGKKNLVNFLEFKFRNHLLIQ
jgi:hypothetical protein